MNIHPEMARLLRCTSSPLADRPGQYRFRSQDTDQLEPHLEASAPSKPGARLPPANTKPQAAKHVTELGMTHVMAGC
jgi:hypothetical protein